MTGSLISISLNVALGAFVITLALHRIAAALEKLIKSSDNSTTGDVK
jgi:hypothetical protein